MNNITGKTKLTALLGSPVAHSISPLMHNEAFKLLDLDYVYLCFVVNESGLKKAVEGLRTINIKGFNLTMPNKTAVVGLLDALTPEAEMIGAVNTVLNLDGKLIGHNTDGYGYMESVKDAGFNIIGGSMAVLGAGGASSAICVQAAKDGVKEIKIFSRKSASFDAARLLCEKINKNTECNASVFDINDKKLLEETIYSSDLLVNTSPVGMAPKINESLIKDYDILRPDLIVSDIIYNPKQTELLKRASEQGCRTFNGAYMLLYQGAKAFEIWTGEKMPVDEIKNKFFM